jgi:hypothetical protein
MEMEKRSLYPSFPPDLASQKQYALTEEEATIAPRMLEVQPPQPSTSADHLSFSASTTTPPPSPPPTFIRRRRSQRVVFFVVFTSLFLMSFVVAYTLVMFHNVSSFRKEPFLDPSVYAKKLADIDAANRLLAEDIVLVSAFFPILDGRLNRHTWQKYDIWFRQLVPILNGRLVLYTTSQFEPYFSDLYLKLPRRFVAPERSISYIRTYADYSRFHKTAVKSSMIIITCFVDPFDLPPMEPYVESFKGSQYKMDPERDIHHPRLYAIWNSKPWFLQQTTYLFKKDEVSLYFWIDAGNRRYMQPEVAFWPDPDRLTSLTGGKGTPILQDRFICMMYERPNHFFPAYYNVTQQYPDNEGLLFSYQHHQIDCMMGAFFGGTLKSVRWFHDTFYNKLRLWKARHFFYGKEQNLFDAIALQYPDKFLTIDLSELPDSEHQFKRYSFLYYFLGGPTQIIMSSPPCRQVSYSFHPFLTILNTTMHDIPPPLELKPSPALPPMKKYYLFIYVYQLIFIKDSLFCMCQQV